MLSTEELRNKNISERAFRIFEARNRELGYTLHGKDLEDWYQAEKELLAESKTIFSVSDADAREILAAMMIKEFAAGFAQFA